MKIAIIEFNYSHIELLPSYYNFLHPKYDISFYVNENVPTDFVSNFSGVPVSYIKRTKIKLFDAFFLSRHLKNNGYSHCLLNTAEGKISRALCFFNSWFGIKNIGVVHNAEKIKSPGITQKSILKRLQYKLVLSDFIKKQFSDPSVQVFYPIFQFFKTNKKSNNHLITLAVIGGVEFKRRDYLSLISLCHDYKEELKNKIVIKIIGNSAAKEGPLLIDQIKKAGVEDFFLLYNHRLSNEDMDKELMSSDLILPLITPDIKTFNEYISYKISGAYNLSYASHIPMIVHEEFKAFEEFNYGNYFYSNTKDLINLLLSLAGNRQDIAQKSEQIRERTQSLIKLQKEIFAKILSL